MNESEIVRIVSNKTGVDEDTVRYYIDRYTKTLALRLKTRKGKHFDNIEEFKKDTFIICPCNIMYLKYSWRKWGKSKRLKQ